VDYATTIVPRDLLLHKETMAKEDIPNKVV